MELTLLAGLAHMIWTRVINIRPQIQRCRVRKSSGISTDLRQGPKPCALLPRACEHQIQPVSCVKRSPRLGFRYTAFRDRGTRCETGRQQRNAEVRRPLSRADITLGIWPCYGEGKAAHVNQIRI